MKNANVWMAAGMLAGLALVGCGAPPPASGQGGSSGSSSSSGSSGTGSSSSSSSSGSSSSSSSSSSGSTGVPFVTAAHDAFPQVPNNDYRHVSGVLSSVQVITITFDGDPQRDALESFGDWVVQSDWLDEVGSDYGVGKGTQVQKVHLPGPAPTAVSDSSIGGYLASKIADHTLPAPDTTLTQPLYVIYYPEATQISGEAGQSCRTYGGYHTSDVYNNKPFAYAVLPTCRYPGQSDADVLAYTQEAASHELIEAATDPYPMVSPTYSIDSYDSPWAFVPGEVADLCVGKRYNVDGYTVQRSWSNTAAAAGGDPCVPVPEGAYFNVTTSHANQTVYATSGQTVTFQVHGWSTADVGPWLVEAQTYTGTFDATPSLDHTLMRNGSSATLTLQIPANLPHQSYTMVAIYSSKTGGDSNFWPVAVVVP